MIARSRLGLLVVVGVGATIGLGGCSSNAGGCAAMSATSCPAPTDESTPAAGECVGKPGRESILQGSPHDLPDGSGVGIGSVDMDAEPPRVRLVLGGVPAAQRDQDNEVSVGDTVRIGTTTYRVTLICPGKVALDPA